MSDQAYILAIVLWVNRKVSYFPFHLIDTRPNTQKDKGEKTH